MSWWGSLARDIAPPILLRAIRNAAGGRIRFVGKYAQWQGALAASRGYASDAIFEKTRDAALKVVRGEAIYERDSVVLDRVEYSYPVIAALLRCACAQDGRLRVLDFGGALGTSYRQFKAFKVSLRELQWSIVEQARYAECGRTQFANHELRFFESIDAALEHAKPNAVLLSGVLQYLEDPRRVIGEIAASTSATIIIDRTYCSSSVDDILTVQVVPPSIYDACYPCWIFSRSRLLQAFGGKYRLADSFDDTTHSWTGPEGAFELAGFILDRQA